jgi:hypothetical protein
VIDGYSVKDAATVLGIPERRVWELIARGVLSSAPEGPDGMRVFLKPPTAPTAQAQDARTSKTDDSDPPRHNGNGAGAHEMSPFRELLTEFRSLTERYGQALLALGEARGEVAALRTRVELLEARMDLRLPGTRPASTVAWEIPGYTSEPEVEAEPVSPPEELAGADAADVAPPPIAETEVLGGPEFEDLEPDEVEFEATAEAVFMVEPEAPPAEAPEAVAAPLEDAAPVPEDVGDVAPVPMELGTEQPTVDAVDELTEGASDEVAADEVTAATPDEAAGDEPTPTTEPKEPDAPRQSAKERRAETRRRRIRGGRTALAGIAEALARAEDQTIAELPGAEDASQALAALRREMEAAREAAAASAESESVESETEAAETPVAEAPVAEAPEADATAGEPAEPVVRADSPYSTEIVEPDWFADGDFTWLEAAQAEEAPQVAVAVSQDEEQTAVIEPPAEDQTGVAEPLSDDQAAGQPVADEQAAIAEPLVEEAAAEPPADEQAGVAEPVVAELEPFEPSAGDQAAAEEEARAAIQDAFEQAPAAQPDVGFEAEQAEADAASAIQDAFEEPAPATPGIAFEGDADDLVARPVDAGEAEPEPIHQAEPLHEVEAEPETEAIQEAFSEVAVPPEWAEPRPGPEEFIAPPVEPAQAPPVAAVAEPRTEPAPRAEPAPSAEPAEGPAGEEELMWLGDEFEEAGLEIGSQGWRDADAPAHVQEAAPVLELSDAELSQLAEDEGWDMSEVEAIRSLLGRTAEAPPETGPAETAQTADAPSEPPPSDAPSSDEAVSHNPGPEPADPAPPAADAVPAESPPPADDATQAIAIEERAHASPSPVNRLASPPRSMTPTADPEWLKGRRGAAADAYRRLRRLFPS